MASVSELILRLHADLQTGGKSSISNLQFIQMLAPLIATLVLEREDYLNAVEYKSVSKWVSNYNQIAEEAGSFQSRCDEWKKTPEDSKKQIIREVFRKYSKAPMGPPLPQINAFATLAEILSYNVFTPEQKNNFLLTLAGSPSFCQEVLFLVSCMDKSISSTNPLLLASSQIRAHIEGHAAHLISTSEQKIQLAKHEMPFLFQLSEISVSPQTRKCSLDARLSDYKNAIARLREYVGEKLFDALDLTNSVITGSAITAACHLLSPLCFYLSYAAVPDDPVAFRKLGFHGRDLQMSNSPKDYHWKRYEDLMTIYNKNDKPIVTCRVVPHTDVDIAVIAESEEMFHQIARKHMDTIVKLYPNAKISVFISQASNNWVYTASDTKSRSFRPIQVYHGSHETILTHHLPVVRGWYSGSTKDFHLTASCVESLLTNTISSFYYFAGEKSPLDVLYKYECRGFRLKLPKEILDLMELHRAFHVREKWPIRDD